MGKRLLLAAMSLFLILQSYKLIIKLETFESNSWLVIIFIAWIINMFITGVFAFAGFGFPTQKLLPESYYLVRNSKSLKRVYKLLKIDLFRKFLLATFWKKKSQQQKFFDGKKDGIDNLRLKSMKSEFGHLLPFLIINVIVVYVLIIGKIKLGIAILLWNILGNLYPIILQRHHRMRIQRIEAIQSQKKSYKKT